MHTLTLSRFILPLLFLASAASAAEKKPNFILCMADDQGFGDVGYRDHPRLKTPVLDQMAATGLRFDRAYAAAPVCSPTRGSVMTGRHPNRFGCFSWGRTLRPEEITVAEALQSAGYATGHFGKWHLGSLRAGNPTSPGQSGFDVSISSPNFYENDALMSENGKVVKLQGESSQSTVAAALPFIRDCSKNDKPFLAVIWFGNPHTPHVPVPELAKMYEGEPKGLQNYYAEITGIDLAMGQLRDELTKLGVRNNTLLWYTSDNGAAKPGSTGGLRGMKGSLWEGGVRVPAIIEWPDRIKTPRATSVPVSTVDIYPTLLELAGAKVNNQPPLDGTSLVPLIDGKMEARTKPLGFWVYPEGGRGVNSSAWLTAMKKEEANGKLAPVESEAEHKPWTQQVPEDDRRGHAAWLDGNFKLHRLAEGKYELYDLGADMKEEKDIASDQPDRVTKMKADLEAWQRSVLKSLNGADYMK